MSVAVRDLVPPLEPPLQLATDYICQLLRWQGWLRGRWSSQRGNNRELGILQHWVSKAVLVTWHIKGTDSGTNLSTQEPVIPVKTWALSWNLVIYPKKLNMATPEVVLCKTGDFYIICSTMLYSKWKVHVSSQNVSCDQDISHSYYIYSMTIHSTGTHAVHACHEQLYYASLLK